VEIDAQDLRMSVIVDIAELNFLTPMIDSADMDWMYEEGIVVASRAYSSRQLQNVLAHNELQHEFAQCMESKPLPPRLPTTSRYDKESSEYGRPARPDSDCSLARVPFHTRGFSDH
jgi:hypothetical protein